MTSENKENETVDIKSTSPALLRHRGIELWESGHREKDEETKKKGIVYLLRAYHAGDVEAAAWIGCLRYLGILRLKDGDSKKDAIKIIYQAACDGSLTARRFLNQKCMEQYEELIQARGSQNPAPGPLVDFSGNRIHINKTGWTVPIDAVLEYVNGINRLTLSLNLLFFDNEVSDQGAYEKAVISGIKAWEGEYQVFGGQKLYVDINVRTNTKLLDSVLVMAVTESVSKAIKKTANKLNTKNAQKNVELMIDQGRSASVMGFKGWSVRSRKIIYIVSTDGSFCDYEEIKHIAKHEFGHALGLGDLYASPRDALEGVEKGTFTELDGYYISDKIYNLVMSDHHGPVSNNDIEMVVLAYSENAMQLYQKQFSVNDEVSKALGRGN